MTQDCTLRNVEVSYEGEYRPGVSRILRIVGTAEEVKAAEAVLFPSPNAQPQEAAADDYTYRDIYLSFAGATRDVLRDHLPREETKRLFRLIVDEFEDRLPLSPEDRIKRLEARQSRSS